MKTVLAGIVIIVVGVLQLTASWMRKPSWDMPMYRQRFALRHPRVAGIVIIAVGVAAVAMGVTER